MGAPKPFALIRNRKSGRLMWRWYINGTHAPARRPVPRDETPRHPMESHRLRPPGLILIRPDRHGDSRGWFSETYNERRFAEAGIVARFVQDNHAYSADRGTVRGLHFQAPPFAQAKLIRVVRGSIFDVAVDVRRDSPDFGRWASVVLSAGEGSQLFIPVGFAHGYCTLEPETDVLYKVDNFYSAGHEFGVRWNDPALGIEWPIESAILSAKDERLPLLADLPDHFAGEEAMRLHAETDRATDPGART